MLATIDTVDFLYTCPGHLEDRGFASSLGGDNGAGGGRKVEPTAEEIAKVKAEWEEKQKRKLDKKANEKEKEKEKEKETEDDEAKAKGTSSQDASTSLKSAPASTPSPTPTHQRYALHADFFASEPL